MRWLLSVLVTVLSFLYSAELVLCREGGNYNPVMNTDITAETLNSAGASPAILEARSEIFGTNIHMISQQQGSVLLPFVVMEGMVGNGKSINRLGVLDPPFIYGGRGSNIETSNPPNDVRWINATRYYQACFVDNYDQIRTLWDIRGAYNNQLGISFGRLYDRVIIANALGTVCGGKNRGQQISLPNTQRIVAIDQGVDLSGTTAGTADNARFSGLNIEVLRYVRRRMKRNHVIQKGDMLVMVVTGNEIDSMLGINNIVNRDFTNTRGLWSGEVSALMGFLFVETELVPHNSSAIEYNTGTGAVVSAALSTKSNKKVLNKQTGVLTTSSTSTSDRGTVATGKGLRCFCMVAGKSLCFGINVNMMTFMEQITLKHKNWLIYHSTEIGATRKEEVAVMEIITSDVDVA